MKPLLILIIGCIPLAGLTAWSIVDLATVECLLAEPVVSGDWHETALLADEALARAKGDRPAVDALAEADLLAASPLASLDAVPESSPLRTVADYWPRWTRARRMVGKIVQAEQLALGNDPEQIREAVRQFDMVNEKFGKLPPPGAAVLLESLDRRRTAVQAKITRREKQLSGELKVQQARAAFQPQHYAECVRHCDELLADHADAVDASILSTVRVLRDRAQFRADVEKLISSLSAADDQARLAAIRPFVSRYSDRARRTESERRILEEYDAELVRLERQAGDVQQGRAASKRLAEFEAALPGDFAARVAAGLQIVEQYPTSAVKSRMQAAARRWIAERLAEKKLAEAPQVREMETVRGELIRGFIKEVKSPDGAVIGYKRYATLEQFRDPASEVGTFMKKDLRREPAETAPRCCEARYEQARSALLAHPEQNDRWLAMADLCKALDVELAAYRARPGASGEALSFAAEEKFLRTTAAGTVWKELRRLL